MSSFLYEWEEAERNEELFSLEFDVVFHYQPGSPGKLYGPPENCYPPEPAEAEVTEVHLVNLISETEDREPTPEECEYWEERFMNEIADTDELFERMCDEGEEAEQAAEDAYWDARIDEELERRASAEIW